MVDAISTTQAGSRLNSGSQMLASNFETFLLLLTAQLKNQDPLSPVDSNQFTSQLTQMAGVEQQLLTNDLLTALLEQSGGGGMANAANYIGREATAAWEAVKFQDGQATWSYELASNAASATVQVLNGNGDVIWTGQASQTSEGIHDFTWNGQTTGGGQVQEGGVYTLRVTAASAGGSRVDSQVLIRGRVSGVEMYNGQPYLTIGRSVVPLTHVIALEEQAQAQLPPDEDEESLLASIASALNPFN
ncbi:flagellar hook assembly protein FlgD [Brevundimonas sp.]|uniref:flagellar hook assembly protein FlgD n=1 Tax=Brevundimonas sp. TaxID=1871086 RepID=UPI00391D168C